ncbi:amidase domain-containing protein [Neobacillus sp. WH10]|uniref:amidase domain-containing protein n=1 Tax=Neobacillus sp. WH10 TaxID=3047873 RepID=UPI0024C1DFE7|nr:amidase domain-containing protein [Neobacillus sp. WH10]WHY77303.1 amidase domain-containing protein [Neobacillus sp. WH10]
MGKMVKKFLLITIILIVSIPANLTVYQGNFLGLQSVSVKAATLNGWVFSGNFWYYYVNGVKQIGWQSINGKWYYLDPSSGAMKTGWLKDGERWYYFDSTGAMLTGWQSINGKWYYLLPTATNENEKVGQMKTGWLKDGERWYYFDSTGAMLTGWQFINGKWYYLLPTAANENEKIGQMKTGWLKAGERWYYFDSTGAMLTGWLTLNNEIYYLNTSGVMVTGMQYIEDKRKWFQFNDSGQLIKKQGWQTLNGRQVYYDLDDYGLLTNRWYFVDNQWREFDYNGYLVVTPNDSVTLGELEKALLDYFSQNNMPYKVGTPEYSQYLIKQLEQHDDPKLARHPQYTLILAYAAEYLHEQTLAKSQSTSSNDMNKTTMAKTQMDTEQTFNMNEVANKTIKQIKEEIALEDEEVQQQIENKQKNTTNSITTMGVVDPYPYDANAAVNYALKWALYRNLDYRDYDPIGSDCTNFVSQAVYAGGKGMVVSPGIDLFSPWVIDKDNYWFTVKVPIALGIVDIKSSASWVNVEAFYKYWAPRVNYVEETWSPMQIYYDARPGDVLQYRYAGSGRRWHSLFVTGKDTNLRTLYISQHVTDRRNYDYGKINKDKNGDSKWIYLRFTAN